MLRDYPEYKISNAGDVHQRKSNLPLATHNINHATPYVLLRKDGHVHQRTVKALLADTFKELAV